MKKLFVITGLALLLTMLNGCLSALYPLFTEKDIVFEPRLVGSWSEKGDPETLVFTHATAADCAALPPGIQRLATKGYIVSLNNAGHTTEKKYLGFITKLGQAQYLDFFPLPTGHQLRYNTFYRQHYIPQHSFYRLRFNTNGSIEIGQLKGEFLQEQINNKLVRIEHEVMSNGHYLITAPTEQLQQYVLKYANVPDAYETGTTYFRLPSNL